MLEASSRRFGSLEDIMNTTQSSLKCLKVQTSPVVSPREELVRVRRYNQLLRIEEELGSEATFAGAAFRKPASPAAHIGAMAESGTTERPKATARGRERT